MEPGELLDSSEGRVEHSEEASRQREVPAGCVPAESGLDVALGVLCEDDREAHRPRPILSSACRQGVLASGWRR